MLTHKEFYFWLEGYLQGRLENEHISIGPIVEKMNQVKDINPIGISRVNHSTPPIPNNPFKDAGYDDLGKPPKIVM